MENEMIYSTIVFNRSDYVKPAAVDPAEEVIYAEVKKNAEASLQNTPETEHSAVVMEEVRVSQTASYRRAAVCLGLLCLLLLAGLLGMCVFNLIQVSQHSALLARYNNESSAHQRLQAEKFALEREKHNLTVQRGQLNLTLSSILYQFSRFPVSEYCQFTQDVLRCEPCMKNWVQNGSSCYFFYTGQYSWKTWEESQRYCNEFGGHLAIIDNREEMEFIRKYIPYYYDRHHGYWIGLHKKNDMWVWSTGAALNREFWAHPYYKSETGCVVTNPSVVSVNNWETKSCQMYNKWICEMRVIEWPSKM